MRARNERADYRSAYFNHHFLELTTVFWNRNARRLLDFRSLATVPMCCYSQVHRFHLLPAQEEQTPTRI